MALIRWEPTRELHSLQQEMNRLFGTFFDTPANAAGTSAARRWIPAMDLVETDEHFVLRADLPGLAEDDITLEVEDRVLTLSGERKPDDDMTGEGYFRLERPTGTFSRSLTLPDGVDAEGVTAAFDHGVLEVHIPKPEERRPRRVRIGVGDRPAELQGTASEDGNA